MNPKSLIVLATPAVMLAACGGGDDEISTFTPTPTSTFNSQSTPTLIPTFTPVPEVTPTAAITPTPLPEVTPTIEVPAPTLTSTPVPQVREIEINIQGLTFDPSSISLEPGEQVRLIVSGIGGFHTFTVKDLDIRLGPGEVTQTTDIIIVPDSGMLVFYCEFHGFPDGQGMAGTFQVSAE